MVPGSQQVLLHYRDGAAAAARACCPAPRLAVALTPAWMSLLLCSTLAVGAPVCVLPSPDAPCPAPAPAALQIKPRRQYRQTVARVLTQAELLAEAAKTEIENTRSLQVWQPRPVWGFFSCCSCSCVLGVLHQGVGS